MKCDETKRNRAKQKTNNFRRTLKLLLYQEKSRPIKLPFTNNLLYQYFENGMVEVYALLLAVPI